MFVKKKSNMWCAGIEPRLCIRVVGKEPARLGLATVENKGSHVLIPPHRFTQNYTIYICQQVDNGQAFSGVEQNRGGVPVPFLRRKEDLTNKDMHGMK